MDRDGRQGWSRAAEAGWERVFGRRLPPAAYFTPGEIIEELNSGVCWRVAPNYDLEEVPRAVPPS